MSKKSKEENLPATTEAGLSSASLAKFANYDVEQFKDVTLDVNEQSELFANDILIPKIWLAQQMSELVKENKAVSGQFLDSQSGELLAENGEILSFVVLKTFKRWHTFELIKTPNKVKKEFMSSEIMTLKNANLAYQETVEGKEIVRRQVISAYVLIERDAVKGVNKPYIIDFAASSKLGGRKMISDIKTLGNNGLPSFVGFFKMTSHEETFEDGSAFVKDVSFGGYLPKESMQFLIQCRKDLDTIEDQIVIDDKDVIDSTAKQAGKRDNGKVVDSVNNTEAGI